MPNYLGTQTNLTGIPSLLLSGLQSVEDSTVQTALYQIQNWANSFFPWKFLRSSGLYTTGGVSSVFRTPFATAVDAITFGPIGGTLGSQVSIVNFDTTQFTAQIFLPGGAELTNGAAFQFFYMAIGH